MVLECENVMTKTQHYRKITKPILERKRRARMNSYLDELKLLIMDTLEEQGEHVNKLEKADVLEMTVNYLKTEQNTKQNNQFFKDNSLKSVTTTTTATTTITKTPSSQRFDNINFDRFCQGFCQATYDVSRALHDISHHENDVGAQLMQHLRYQLENMNDMQNKPQSNRLHINQPMKSNNVWRPWN